MTGTKKNEPDLIDTRTWHKRNSDFSNENVSIISTSSNQKGKGRKKLLTKIGIISILILLLCIVFFLLGKNRDNKIANKKLQQVKQEAGENALEKRNQELFEQGEKYRKRENYKQAIKFYNMIDDTWGNYRKTEANILQCRELAKQEAIEKAEEAIHDDSYQTAQDTVIEVFEITGQDNDLKAVLKDALLKEITNNYIKDSDIKEIGSDEKDKAGQQRNDDSIYTTDHYDNTTTAYQNNTQEEDTQESVNNDTSSKSTKRRKKSKKY